MNYKKIVIFVGLAMFIFMIGYFVGMIVFGGMYIESREQFDNLCVYSNKLINVVNIQSELIEMCPICFDKENLDLTKITPLNCSLLKGGI